MEHYAVIHEGENIIFPHDENVFSLCPFAKLTKEKYEEGKWKWGGGSLFKLYIDVLISEEDHTYNRYYLPKCFDFMITKMVENSYSQGLKEGKKELENLQKFILGEK